MLPRAIYTFNAIPIKIPPTFFTKLEQIIIKFLWNQKRPRRAGGMLKKKTKADGVTIQLQTFYKAEYCQDSMVLTQKQTHRSMNRIENPEMDLNSMVN